MKSGKFIDITNFITEHELNDRVEIVYSDDKIGLKFLSHAIVIALIDVEESELPFDFSLSSEYTTITVRSHYRENKLTTLKNLPEDKCSSLYIGDLNYIKTLEGCPRQVYYMEVKSCPGLTSLIGVPDVIESEIRLDDLNISEIDYFPKKAKCVTMNNLKIQNLRGINTREPIGELEINNIKDLDLSYVPYCKNLYLRNCTFTDISGLENCEACVYIDKYFVENGCIEKYVIERGLLVSQ